MAEPKQFLTAAEVMERLRLGRTTVYQHTRLYLATGGAEGLPCRRYGRSLRFPAAELEAIVDKPRPVSPPPAKVDEPDPVSPKPATGVQLQADAVEARTRPTRSRPNSRSRSRSPRPDARSQLSLLSDG
jgi:hypothetical protein